MIVHQCTQCGHTFEINRQTRLFSIWKFIFSLMPLRSLDYFQAVFCTNCGHIENDGRILIFGILSPKMYVFVVFLMAMCLIVYAVIDVVRSW
jgi:hypothetical protein